jgi:hypothetical protein
MKKFFVSEEKSFIGWLLARIYSHILCNLVRLGGEKNQIELDSLLIKTCFLELVYDNT